MARFFVYLLPCIPCLLTAGLSGAKPNVLLIMADDVSWEAFGCYGAEDYETPNIDRLAQQGVRFKHCYSTPICTPSRVMIMTGKYNFRNYTHFGYLNPAEKTFAHLLRDAGYKTAIAGKWQLNGLYNAKQFEGSRDPSRPQQAGFDAYCLWQLTKTKAEGGERFWSPALEQNGRFLTSKDNAGLYGPDIMSDFLCDFMERHQDEPFFIYYPTVLVHDPFVPTPDTIGSGARTQAANKEPKQASAKKENFVAMVEYFDRIVGKLVRKLDEIGQLENTLILLTADNGTHPKIRSNWNGQVVQGGKGSMLDSGTHVPLIAYWKGRTLVGAELDDLVDFTDVYPTIAEVAGVELQAEDPKDGQSFLARSLGQPSTDLRDWILCYYQPYWGKHFKTGIFARNADYKLYADGRFYQVPNDLIETSPLGAEVSVEVHDGLKSVLDACPPINLKGSRSSPDRPLYPDWNELELRAK